MYLGHLARSTLLNPSAIVRAGGGSLEDLPIPSSFPVGLAIPYTIIRMQTIQMPLPIFPAHRWQFSWINIFGSPPPISLLEFLLILCISALSVLPSLSEILFSPRFPMICRSPHYTDILISHLRNVAYFLPAQNGLAFLRRLSINFPVLYSDDTN
jgi:hypothetical protein